MTFIEGFTRSEAFDISICGKSKSRQKQIKQLHFMVTFINFAPDENNKGKDTIRLLSARQI